MPDPESRRSTEPDLDLPARQGPTPLAAQTDFAFPPRSFTAAGKAMASEDADLEKAPETEEEGDQVEEEEGVTEVTEFAVLKDALGLGTSKPPDEETGASEGGNQEMSEKPTSRPVSVATSSGPRRRRRTAGATAEGPDGPPTPTIQEPSPAHLRSPRSSQPTAERVLSPGSTRNSVGGARGAAGGPGSEVGKGKAKTVLRIERDWVAGGPTNGMVQFWDGWLEELDGRITPLQFQHALNELNAALAAAYESPLQVVLDNLVDFLSLYLYHYFFSSHYKRRIRTFGEVIERQNKEVFNPAGLNLLHPRHVGYMFMEIELY